VCFRVGSFYLHPAFQGASAKFNPPVVSSSAGVFPWSKRTPFTVPEKSNAEYSLEGGIDRHSGYKVERGRKINERPRVGQLVERLLASVVGDGKYMSDETPGVAPESRCQASVETARTVHLHGTSKGRNRSEANSKASTALIDI
jgi:hypothetical protein